MAQIYDANSSIPMLSVQIISERDSLREDSKRLGTENQRLKADNERLREEMRQMQIRHEAAQGDLGRKNQSRLAIQQETTADKTSSELKGKRL